VSLRSGFSKKQNTLTLGTFLALAMVSDVRCR